MTMTLRLNRSKLCHFCTAERFQRRSRTHSQASPTPVTSKVDRVSLCVVGNGVAGNPRSVLLNYADKQFVFNCGEGVQRTLSNFGFKSSRFERLFFTSNTWWNVSGLSSMLLARFDARITSVDIVGPAECAKAVYESIRFDTKLRRVKYTYVDTKDEFSHDNGKLVIKSVQLKSSMAYLGHLEAISGGISLEKCYRQTVPRDRVVDLERGENVQLADGRLVRPIDVHDRDQPARTFLIFEATDKKSIDELLAHPNLSDSLPTCDCIVHFTSNHLLSQPNYRNFLAKHSAAYHLLLVESNPSLSLYSMHSFQNQLNHVDEILFPKLKENCKLEPISVIDQKVINCPTGLSYNLRLPREDDQEISLERIPAIDYAELSQVAVHQDGSVREGFEESLDRLKVAQHSLILDTSLPTYPEFVFLGTASSLALPIRNVSSVLVNLSKDNSILLDCGEGTYGQLRRFYGPQAADEVIKRLRLIFISHHHSDHHLGLVELLGQLKGKKTCPMIIMPPMVSSFISRTLPGTFGHLANLRDCYRYILANKYEAGRLSIDRIGLRDLKLVPVEHCAHAFGIVMTTTEGYKFVYSGDTMPCERLVHAGDDCDLLIHEATVEDDLANFARANFHSTVSQAINVSERMRARFTMLTHFSQRYGKLPFVVDRARIGIAFDNMKITPRTMARVPLITETLKMLYGRHLENLEYRSELYRRRGERENLLGV